MPFKMNADRHHRIRSSGTRSRIGRSMTLACLSAPSLTVSSPRPRCGLAPLNRGPRRVDNRTTPACDQDSTDLARRIPAGAAPEGLIGIHHPPARLDLAVPDHSTLSRRAETLQVLDQHQAANPSIC